MFLGFESHTGLPLTDGNAHTLSPAASEQDARTQMQAILN